MNFNTIFKAIKKIYPLIEGGYSYLENQVNPADCLIWENTKFPKPKWSEIEALIPVIELQNAKDNKLASLEAFILSKKAEKYTSHFAPEIIDGSRIEAEVKFFWHVDNIPNSNSNITPESVLAKCTMDYVSCMNFAKKTGTDYASEKNIYDNCIKQKIVPYSTTIIKKDAEGKDKEQAGVVNISPVAFSIADHIQNREINNNKIFKLKEYEINSCKTVEEVEAIKFQ
jgi:hypothetical protein